MYGCKKCLKETEGNGWIKRFFACVPSVLDYRLKKRDFWFHRSYDGLTLRLLKRDGHALLAYLVPSLFLIFLIYGPTLGWRGLPALAILVLSWVCLYLVAWIFGEKHLMWGQLLVLSGVALVVWYWAGPKALEFDKEMYQNLFLPLILPYVLIPLLLAKVLSVFLFLKLRYVNTFRDFLPHVKLLPKPPKAPVFSYWFILHSLVHAPLRYPLHLLFFPALGSTKDSCRVVQAGNQDIRTNGFQPDASSGSQAAIPDVADVLEKSYVERGFHRFLHSYYRHFPDFFLRSSCRIVQRCCGG